MSRKTVLLLAVALVALAADQVTKYLAVSRLTTALDGQSGLARLRAFVTEQNLDNMPAEPGKKYRATKEVRFIEDYWHFRYVENPGAAWGLFANLPQKVREPFFVVVSLIAVAFIFWMYRRVPDEHRMMQWALALVMGGAFGNFADRLMRGYVIDFIDWHWRNQPGMRWPTFNIADAAISVGVFILAVDAVLSLFRGRSLEPALAGAGGPELPSAVTVASEADRSAPSLSPSPSHAAEPAGSPAESSAEPPKAEEPPAPS